jgi:hypothetical protein
MSERGVQSGGSILTHTAVDALTSEVAAVRETTQPTHVSLWLRPDPPPRRREGLE